MGVRPLAFHQRRWDDGRTLLRAPLGDVMVEAFGFPHYQTHRADLLATLVGALPAERLHVGHRFRSLRDHGDRVEVEFDNGAIADVDVLVGADGIHSDVRAALFGPDGPGLHRLRRLPRARAGRAPAAPRARGDGADLDGARRPLRPLLRAAAQARQLRRDLRPGRLDARVVDRSRRGRGRARGVRGLAPAGAGDHRRGRRDVHLGAVRPPAAGALVVGPRHAARRRVPPDAAVHGPGRRAGARGRGDADGLPRARRAGRARGAAPLRGAAAAARLADPGDVDREQDAASTCPTGPSSASATQRMAGGSTDFALKAVEWIYAPRRPPSRAAPVRA